jgi:EAL domain-containing protein (putative c-di-GMP-specific phosphodiesterase class I)
MQLSRLAYRIGLSPWTPGAGLGVLATLVVLSDGTRSSATIAILAVAAFCWVGWLQRDLRSIVQRLAPRGDRDEPSPARLVDAHVARLEHQLGGLRHRTLALHPISGLPLREALIGQIERDAGGILGVVALKDVDRLSAFDPALADRVVAVCSSRMRAMLPGSRFLAQINRGHIGIWFGTAVARDDAWAELDAVAYALGAAVEDGATPVIPQVAFRLSHFDAGAGIAPGAFVARALACLALPDDEAPDISRPAADPGTVARESFALEQDLRQAIDRRELYMLYQPLVDATRGCVWGAEALLRWDHPVRGTISPSMFVPILEAIGLADEIGVWALNAAVREARRWDAIGMPQMRVAVNVSGLQLQGDDLPRVVERTLRHHGVRADRLGIELTESVATSDAAHCRQVFAALRGLGVELAVDDFGTGYSGFSSLRALAFDKIKIDREFVSNVDSRRDSQAICQSILALGRGLGIRVLAEGVERREELDWLRRHGCEHFQGFYFGAPMPGTAFTAFAQDGDRLAGLLAPDAELAGLGL